MPEYAFDVDTTVVATGPGRWRGDVTPRWDIGTVPNGGYVLCVALAAVRAAVRQPHPLTVTAHYLGPCEHGPVDIEVDVVKEGRTLSTATARLMQGGRPRLLVLTTYADLHAQHGPTLISARPPELADPEACSTDRPVGAGFPVRPPIVDRVEFRGSHETAARLARRDGGTARLDGWMRLTDGRPVDVHALPLLVDAAPPAVFAAMETGWVPTLELTVHVRAIPAAGWLRMSVATTALVEGLLEEDCQLWDADDNLVAMSRQLARVLSPVRTTP